MPTVTRSLFTILTIGNGSKNLPTTEEISTAWLGFKAAFDKKYDRAQESERLEIFRQNFIFMQHENLKGLPYTLGVNQFSDLTRKEYAERHLGFTHLSEVWGKIAHVGEHDWQIGEELSAEIDWTKNNAVTPPKDQGQCGSCWAFSTTGALEGAWEVATGSLVPMSEQQLMDCSDANDACEGGSMPLAFEYATTAGVCTEASYGYEAAKGSCKAETCSTAIPSGGVTGYKTVKSESEKALLSALQIGPVSVAIEADQMSFQMYQGGILTGSCGSNLDHGVLAVGYGEDYWLVKNSWGTSWGAKGYIKLARGLDDGPGQCGILEMASFPIVEGSDVPTPPPTPVPPPAPTPPTPPPAPTPAGSSCFFKDTEDECLASDQGCVWCYFSVIDVGLCAEPDFSCSTGPLEPPKQGPNWLAPVISVTALVIVAVLAVAVYVRRCRKVPNQQEDLNISLQGGPVEVSA